MQCLHRLATHRPACIHGGQAMSASHGMQESTWETYKIIQPARHSLEEWRHGGLPSLHSFHELVVISLYETFDVRVVVVRHIVCARAAPSRPLPLGAVPCWLRDVRVYCIFITLNIFYRRQPVRLTESSPRSLQVGKCTA